MTTRYTEARNAIDAPGAVGSPVERPVRPLYAERDHMAQGEHYLRHIDAMTREGLHDKSSIAGELAARDIEIERLRARVLELEAVHEDASGAILQAVADERERLCAAIKAADDKASESDYMLDSDDCISVIRGTWNPGA